MSSNDLGNTGSGGALTDTDTVDITVTPVNDAPVAGADSASVAEDSSVDVDVLDNDTPGPLNESSQTLNIDSITVDPLHGTATIDDNGTATTADDFVVYTPAANYFGPDSFTYKVCDNGQSGSPLADDFKCSTAVASITVTPVNDAPVAGADSASVAEDSSVDVDVLDNDTPGRSTSRARP